VLVEADKGVALGRPDTHAAATAADAAAAEGRRCDVGQLLECRPWSSLVLPLEGTLLRVGLFANTMSVMPLTAQPHTCSCCLAD
jgi:hypothetical protein